MEQCLRIERKPIHIMDIYGCIHMRNRSSFEYIDFVLRRDGSCFSSWDLLKFEVIDTIIRKQTSNHKTSTWKRGRERERDSRTNKQSQMRERERETEKWSKTRQQTIESCHRHHHHHHHHHSLLSSDHLFDVSRLICSHDRHIHRCVVWFWS